MDSTDSILRERVLKLELKMEEMVKKVDNLNQYVRQLHDYLNQSSRS
ncbi:MAG TPA: hypothetical protein VGR56_00415 [Nitrososphaerales archaeon]|nr:hypothetical protein [Nitrososphaerales archaeon]